MYIAYYALNMHNNNNNKHVKAFQAQKTRNPQKYLILIISRLQKFICILLPQVVGLQYGGEYWLIHCRNTSCYLKLSISGMGGNIDPNTPKYILFNKFVDIRYGREYWPTYFPHISCYLKLSISGMEGNM